MKKMITAFSMALFYSLFAQGALTVKSDLSQEQFYNGEKQTVYLKIEYTGIPVDQAVRAPLNLALVIDQSGSMSGEKIRRAREAAILAVRSLQAEDIVSVIAYDSTVEVIVPATKVRKKEQIISKINELQPKGSTALFAGVSQGAEEMRKFIEANRINRMILLSDGQANVGPSSPYVLGNLGAVLVEEGISVSTIGLGYGYNEDLMSQLAFKSDGGHYFVESAGQLVGVFEEELGMALKVVATDIRTKITCLNGLKPVRVLGRQGEISDNNIDVFIHQIYGDGKKSIVVEMELDPALSDGEPMVKIDTAHNSLSEEKEMNATETVASSWSESKSKAENTEVATVMVDVLRLLATEKNELALEMRDKGQVEKAKELLIQNQNYLSQGAVRYGAPSLAEEAAAQADDASNLEGEDWAAQRKKMKARQVESKIAK